MFFGEQLIVIRSFDVKIYRLEHLSFHQLSDFVKSELDVCAGFKFEDHLPEPVALAALDHFDRFEPAECRIGSIEPFAERVRFE